MTANIAIGARFIIAIVQTQYKFDENEGFCCYAEDNFTKECLLLYFIVGILNCVIWDSTSSYRIGFPVAF
jgi:hypothetical protein